MNEQQIFSDMRAGMFYRLIVLRIMAAFPAFALQEKAASWWWRLVKRVFPASFEAITTIGTTVWVPPTWKDWPPIDRALILAHEWVHMLQRKRFRFFILRYLLALPAWWNPFRVRVELEAYAAGAMIENALTGTVDFDANAIEAAQALASTTYLWVAKGAKRQRDAITVFHDFTHDDASREVLQLMRDVIDTFKGDGWQS